MIRRNNLRHLCLSVFLLLPALLSGHEVQAKGGDSLLSFKWNWQPHIGAISSSDTTDIEDWLRRAESNLYTHSDSAALYARKAISLSRRNQYPDGMAKGLLTIGRYHVARNEFELAIQSFKSAYPYCTQALFNKSKLLIRWNNEIAKPYIHLGHTDSALSYIIRAKEGAEILRDTGLLIQAYNYLGILWISDRDFESAIQNLQHAQQLSLQYNSQNLAFTYNNLASTYGILNDTAALYHYTEKALKTATHIRDKRFAMKQMGSYYMKTKRFRKAIQLFQESLTLSDSSNPSAAFSAYWGISESYFWLKQYEPSLSFADKALDIMEHQNRLDLVRVSFYNFLAHLHYNKGDYRKAFLYKDYYSRLNDSLNSVEKNKVLYRLEMKSKLEIKDKEIAQKQLALLQQQSHLKNRNILIIVISSSFLFITGIFWTYYRSIRRKVFILKQQEEINTFKAITYGEEQERIRVARDLHDGIGSLLSAATINLNLLSDNQQLEQDKQFNQTKTLLEEASTEVRKMAHNLMPHTLLQNDLPTAIRLYCAYMFPDHKSPHIEIRSFGHFDSLDKEFLLVLYRIIQELLQNIIKHAQATQAFLQLHLTQQLLSITMEDNGIGYQEDIQKEGLGLRNIHARVKSLNGKISTESTPGKGTSVYIEFDLAAVKEPESEKTENYYKKSSNTSNLFP